MKKSISLFIILNIACLSLTMAQIGQEFSLRNVVQPGPEAARLVNYFLTPVNTSTGNANVDIPLYSLNVDGLNIPITLSYHTSGIRVDELSGSVGLGWSLNTGGGVYRNINGQADDRDNTGGFLYTSQGTAFIDSLNSLVNDYSTQISILRAISNNRLDINQDDYTYNFIGRAGSLYFTSTFQLKEAMNTNTVFSYDSKSMNTVIAKDKEGNQFTFSDKETTTNESFPTGDIFGTTAWKLSSINTANGRNVSFSYNDYTIRYHFPSGDAITHKLETPPNGVPGSCYTGGYSFSHFETSLVNSCKLINKITTDQAIVSFFYSTNTNATNWQQKLDRIEVKDIESGTVIRTIMFSYSVFGGDPRLRLDAVTLKGKDLQTEQLYTFSYNPLQLPSIASMSKDIFGYYNGATNTTLLSAYNVPGVGASLYNSNRTVHATYIKAGTLEQITYPTGGKTKFTYGPNIVGGIYAPGTRIDQIDVLDESNNIVNTKTFTYSGLTGRSTSFPCYSTLQEIVDRNFFFSSSCWTYSSGYNHLELESPKNFFYNKVITAEKGPSGQDLVTVEYYADPNDDGDRFGSLLNNGEYQPKLFKVEYYKGSPAPGNLVKDHSYNYVVKSNIGDDYLMYRVTPSYLTNMAIGGGAVVQCLNFTPEIETHYRLRSEWYTLTSESENDYRAGDTVINRKVYTYENTDHYFPTKITTYNSDNSTIEQTNKYVMDFKTVSPYNEMVTRNQISAVITQKTTKNALPVNFSQVNYYKPYPNIYVPQTTAIQTGSGPLETRLHYYGYDAKGNPLEVTETGGPSTSYLWSYNGQYSIAEVKNAIQEDIAYAGFESDSKGNWSYIGATITDDTAPTGRRAYHLSGGSLQKTGLTSTRSYLLTYWAKSASAAGISGGTATAMRSREGWTQYRRVISGVTSVTVSGSIAVDDVRLHPVEASMNSYTYDQLVGMTSHTDASGNIFYYQYDDFGRLEAVKDLNGHVVEDYQYHYGNQ